jgi:hypothetical protein
MGTDILTDTFFFIADEQVYIRIFGNTDSYPAHPYEQDFIPIRCFYSSIVAAPYLSSYGYF